MRKAPRGQVEPGACRVWTTARGKPSSQQSEPLPLGPDSRCHSCGRDIDRGIGWAVLQCPDHAPGHCAGRTGRARPGLRTVLAIGGSVGLRQRSSAGRGDRCVRRPDARLAYGSTVDRGDPDAFIRLKAQSGPLGRGGSSTPLGDVDAALRVLDSQPRPRRQLTPEGTTVEWPSMMLSDVPIRRVDLFGVSLRDADFAHSTFDNVLLSESDLSGANLSAQGGAGCPTCPQRFWSRPTELREPLPHDSVQRRSHRSHHDVHGPVPRRPRWRETSGSKHGRRRLARRDRDSRRPHRRQSGRCRPPACRPVGADLNGADLRGTRPKDAVLTGVKSSPDTRWPTEPFRRPENCG